MARKWLIFDMMGVIFVEGDDTNNLLVPYVLKKNPTLDRKRIIETYLRASLGMISNFEFWHELASEEEYPQIESNYLDNCLNIDPEFTQTAEQLSQNYNLAILSNDLHIWSGYLRRKYQLDHLFQEVVISGSVGLRKPDPVIFKLLLAKIDIPAIDCIMIDDRLKNLETAASLGFQTILFNRKSNCQPNSQIGGMVSSFTELNRVLHHQ